MARSTAGLTEPDIAELRRQLADGKRPRVQLSGPHFPAGAAGTVVRIGSPDTDGADYLRVRVKVNGMLDELAFAPGELSLRRPGRATKAKAAGRPAKATGRPATAAGRPATATGRPATAAGRPATAAARPATQPAKSAPAGQQARSSTRRAPAAVAGSAVAGSPVAGSAGDGAPAGRGTEVVSERSSATPSSSAGNKPAGSPATGTPRRRKAGAAPKVSFTVSSSGASWTVAATRGNKALVRNVGVPPGVVSALAELLGQPALAEAVSEINDAALDEARARAEQLRAELEQLEEVLATHRRP